MPAPNPSVALCIPRRFAVRLLHQAQIADAPFLYAITAPIEPPGAAPDGWVELLEPVPADDIDAALARGGRRVWAFYRHRPDAPAPPQAEDFADRPDLLRLTASLAIKGVLQLRGWWWLQGAIVEQELDVEAG